MLRALRIVIGAFLIGLLLAAAQYAVRDCTAELFRLDNCLWLRASEYLGLPWQSKGLRAVFFEVMGAALLGGLYLTYRYVLSPGLRPQSNCLSSDTALTASVADDKHVARSQAAEAGQEPHH